MSRTVLQLELFKQLRKYEKDAMQFTYQDVASAVGYAVSTVKTYVGRKLKGVIVFPTDNKGIYICRGALKMPEDKYLEIMSQVNPLVLQSKKSSMYHRIVRRALNSCLLSIELYNRPTQENRVEAFCIIIVNAWELLLKAMIINRSGQASIYYPSENETEKKSLSFRGCIKKCITNENDPVRVNLEFLAELRDKAVHLLIPEMQRDLSRLFQASVFNFLSYYQNLTGHNPMISLGSGLLSIVADRKSFQEILIKERYSSLTAQEATDFLKKFREVEVVYDQSEQFAVSFDYKLVLTKKEHDGDIILTPSYNKESSNNAVIIHKPKDIDETHPLTMRPAIDAINEKLNCCEINQYDFQAIVFKENIKKTKSCRYHLVIKSATEKSSETHRYSPLFIDFIVDKIENNDEYVLSCRCSYRTFLKKKK